MIPTFVALLGHHLDVTVLVDSRKAGHQRLSLLAETGYLMQTRIVTVGEVLGRKLEVEYRPLPENDPVRRRPDLTRARERLGWKPTTPLHDGLQRTVEYFMEMVPGTLCTD